MKIIFFGDVVGKAGRNAIFTQLPELQETCQPDLLILNGENAAHGFGITKKICLEFFNHGIDVITLGNHAWDRKDIIEYIKEEQRLVRPLNFPENTPGNGLVVLNTDKGHKVLVAQVMGKLFMSPVEDPFKSISECIKQYLLGVDVDCIILDVHAEATSEKMAIGHFLDGKVSMVVGSHSHIPTADAQILPNGTAYQTDAGMCGDYDSVIGMKKEGALNRFLNQTPKTLLEPAEMEATVCAVFVETDDSTGLAKRVRSIRIGGRLESTELSVF
ncbi:MAG: TIGR00282 family metallophosphoesterase [Pseudomonadota bacterium]|nr:TIGR00282 family metallophosphoesterase [Pseudomonadota bacterium]